MEEEIPGAPGTEKPRRPVMLTVLCILTFAGSGLNFVSSILIAVFYDTFLEVAAGIAKSFDLPGMDVISGAGPAFFALSAGIYIISLAGAFRMWGLHKRGFHFYTIAQILGIIAPMYFLHLAGPSVIDLLLSGTFVALYATQLKHMS